MKWLERLTRIASLQEQMNGLIDTANVLIVSEKNTEVVWLLLSRFGKIRSEQDRLFAEHDQDPEVIELHAWFELRRAGPAES
jgi:hypothetical protein